MALLVAALIRAARTTAQTALGVIGTGVVGVTDVYWLTVLSVSGMAAIVSLLQSLIAGLPEVPIDYSGWLHDDR